MRRIQNRGKLKKEGLIISILKSEDSNAERNYMKHFNINTNVNNNNNTNFNNNNNNNTNVNNNNNDVNKTNDDDDGTYDGKIRDKQSDTRAILSRLGNIVTKNDRDKIKKDLYETENKKIFSDEEKEKIYDNLLQLVNKLNKKEKYRYNECDDLDYNRVRDIENLVDNIDDDDDDDDDDYKPILVKSSFNENCKDYESRGDKEKKLLIE